MRKILLFASLVSCMLPGITFAASNAVSKLEFTTDLRSVAVGEISEVITVQTQNASGEEEKLDGTADVVFTSTSATGEFLGGTGKEVTKTMNSGSANKTFYYRDSTEGVHAITVTVTPRTGGTSWAATQNVYVGVDAPAGESGDEDEEEESGSASSSGSSGSSHSSSKKPSTYKKPQTFKMSAGRNRVVLVNTPIYFEAETNSGDRVLDRSIDFNWSFGDGDSDYGMSSKHVYYFPGDYHVVLTARKGREESVSIIKVKVLDNALLITNALQGVNGYVEVKNDSTSEVNIKGLQIISAQRLYIISGDTIIDAKKTIRIPNKVMGFSPEPQNVQLLFPTDEIAFTYTEKTKKENTVALVETVSKEEQEKAMAYYYAHFAYEIDPNQEALPRDPVEDVQEEVKVVVATKTDKQVAAVAEVTKSKGFWGFVRGLFSVE